MLEEKDESKKEDSEVRQFVTSYLGLDSFHAKVRMMKFYREELEEFSLVIGHIVLNITRYMETVKESDHTLPHYHAAVISTKAYNSLMAGFEMLMNGYFYEPPIIFRSALESFSMAWDIIHNAKRFEEYLKDEKFSSTRSITMAKKEIPGIGFIYGHLSNEFTHGKASNSSPVFDLSQVPPRIQVFGNIKETALESRRADVLLSLMLALQCLQLNEVCFHFVIPRFQLMMKVEGGMKLDPNGPHWNWKERIGKALEAILGNRPE